MKHRRLIAVIADSEVLRLEQALEGLLPEEPWVDQLARGLVEGAAVLDWQGPRKIADQIEALVRTLVSSAPIGVGRVVGLEDRGPSPLEERISAEPDPQDGKERRDSVFSVATGAGYLKLIPLRPDLRPPKN